MPVNIYRRNYNPNDTLAKSITALGQGGAGIIQAPAQAQANSLAQIKTLMDIQKLQKESKSYDSPFGAPAPDAYSPNNPAPETDLGGGQQTGQLGQAELERQNKANNVQPKTQNGAPSGYQSSYAFNPKSGWTTTLKPPATPKGGLPQDPAMRAQALKDAEDLSNAKGGAARQQKFDQTEFDKLVKEANPSTTSGRTTVGKAAAANFQANRALKTLMNPVVTNQEAGNAMADIAAIYQNGSPTQFGMSEQQYKTIQGNVAAMTQYLTGKPQDALTPDIKQRLVGVLKDMKVTNLATLKQNLAILEKSKRKIIEKFPNEWNDMKAEILSDDYSGLGDQSNPPTDGLPQKSGVQDLKSKYGLQ